MATVRQSDFYELLGVSDSATADEIRTAYRKLAHRYHPDKTGGDPEAEEKLKRINEAYDVLKNADKRAKYDEERKFSSAYGYAGFEDLNGQGFAGGFADIFSAAFGGGDHARAVQRGANLETTVSVTLAEVATGVSKRVSIRRSDQCPTCAGTGGAVGTSPTPCGECQGAGTVRQGNGFFTMSHTCPLCAGRGTRFATPCAACAGAGLNAVTRDIDVRIPAGIQDGARLRISGEGDSGAHGAPSGDLYVRVAIESDPFFVREGRDLLCETPVTFVEAALGAKVRVPTLSGIADIDIPAGTQSGAKLRMRGMGLPGTSGGGRGDQYVNVLVEVPRKLSLEQRRLLRDFDGSYEKAAHPLRDAFRNLLNRFRGQ